MTPIQFPEVNIVLGAGQPEYQGLPALITKDETRQVISCWELTAEEIQGVIKNGVIWISQLSFGHPVQPLLPSVDKPVK